MMPPATLTTSTKVQSSTDLPFGPVRMTGVRAAFRGDADRRFGALSAKLVDTRCITLSEGMVSSRRPRFASR
jgi:hypothetical protein